MKPYAFANCSCVHDNCHNHNNLSTYHYAVDMPCLQKSTGLQGLPYADVRLHICRNTCACKRLQSNASCHASILSTLEEPIYPDRLMSSQTGITLGASSTTKHACQQQAYLKLLWSWAHAQPVGLMYLPWLMRASLSEAMGQSSSAALPLSRNAAALVGACIKTVERDENHKRLFLLYIDAINPSLQQCASQTLLWQ